ncbi:MAG: hypothetical protein Q8K36_03260 [Alphaproteobacteria bacterium]|nr:hypothetical protein [Alphaproteobacteria bacterium]
MDILAVILAVFFTMLGQIPMEFDLAIEVQEVDFEQFERRKHPRENGHYRYIENNFLSTNSEYQLEEAQMEASAGIEVHEVTFDQFERRITPR